MRKKIILILLAAILSIQIFSGFIFRGEKNVLAVSDNVISKEVMKDKM